MGTGAKPRRAAAYSEAAEIQRRLLADIRDPATKPAVRAGLARAWDIMEDRKRVLRNKPLPGHLRPELAQRRQRRRPSGPLGEASVPPAPAVEPIGPVEPVAAA